MTVGMFKGRVPPSVLLIAVIAHNWILVEATDPVPFPPQPPPPMPPAYAPPYPPAPPRSSVTGQARLAGTLARAPGFVTLAPSYGWDVQPLSYFLAQASVADITQLVNPSSPPPPAPPPPSPPANATATNATGSSNTTSSSSSNDGSPSISDSSSGSNGYIATAVGDSTLMFRTSPEGVFLLPSTTAHALITLPPTSLTLDPLTSVPLPFSVHTSILPTPETGIPSALVVAHPLGFIASLKMAYNGLIDGLAPYASYSEALEASFRQVMGAPWGLTAGSSDGNSSAAGDSTTDTSQYLMTTVAGSPLSTAGAGGAASSPLTRVSALGLMYADALVAATLGVGANLAARLAAAAPRAVGDVESPCAAGMSGADTAPLGDRPRAGVDFAARKLAERLWANSSDAPDLGMSGGVAEALLQVIVGDCGLPNSSTLGLLTIEKHNTSHHIYSATAALRRTSGRVWTSWSAMREAATVRGPRVCGLDVVRHVAWSLKQVGYALHSGRGVLANATAHSFVAGTSTSGLWGVESAYEALDTWSVVNRTALLTALGVSLEGGILPTNPEPSPPPPAPAPPPAASNSLTQLAGGGSSSSASSLPPLAPPALRVVLMGAGRIAGCTLGTWINVLESEQVPNLRTDAAGGVTPLPRRPSYARVVFSISGGAAGSGCVDTYTKLAPLGLDLADWVVPLPTSTSYTASAPRVVVLDALGLLAARIAEHNWCPANAGAGGTGGAARLGLVSSAAWSAAWTCLGATSSALGSADLVGRGWGGTTGGATGSGSQPLAVAALAAGAQAAVAVGAAAAVLERVMGVSRGDAADAVMRRFASTVCGSASALSVTDGGTQLGLLYNGLWTDWRSLTGGIEASGGLSGSAQGPELPLVQDSRDPVAPAASRRRTSQQVSQPAMHLPQESLVDLTDEGAEAGSAGVGHSSPRTELPLPLLHLSMSGQSQGLQVAGRQESEQQASSEAMEAAVEGGPPGGSSTHRQLAQVSARVDVNAVRVLLQAAAYAAANLTSLLQVPKSTALAAASGAGSFDPVNATIYASKVAAVAQGVLLSALSALASRVAAGADLVEMGGALAELAMSFRGDTLAAAVAAAVVDLDAISSDLARPPAPPAPPAPAPPAPPPQPNDWTTRKIIAIVVGVVGAVAVIALLLLILFCVARRKRAAVKAAEAINSPWNDARMQAQSYPTQAMYDGPGVWQGHNPWAGTGTAAAQFGNSQFYGGPATPAVGYSTAPRYANATESTPAIATLDYRSMPPATPYGMPLAMNLSVAVPSANADGQGGTLFTGHTPSGTPRAGSARTPMARPLSQRVLMGSGQGAPSNSQPATPR